MSEKKPWTIGEILSTSSRYWHSCTIHAGVRLKVFTHLGEKALNASEVAEKAKTGERGMALLLNGLTAMGLLTKQAGTFRNSEASRTLLNKDSPKYIGHIIMHHHHLVDDWARLHEAVITDRPVAGRDHGEATERESFLMGMFNLAMVIAPRLAQEIDLSGRHHLLDLGGGPGTHAIHFCLANPSLAATIFDRPTTEPFARQVAEQFGVAERISFVGGDFNLDPIPGTYDVAWLSQILHSNGPEECARLIHKTVTAMEPGGLIMIHDFFLDASMAAPLFPAIFALNMLINNPRGRSYSEQEARTMLAAAGVVEIRRLPFPTPNDSAIIAGIVS